MAINTAWKIEIGGYGTFVNFTSRVQGMSISQQVDVNVIGRGTCTVTLLNKDGALTPNGGGTYGTRDWFSNAVRVYAVTDTGGATTETEVFAGQITDFQLADDGVFSTVTITALDVLSVLGRTTSATIAAGTTYYPTAFVPLALQSQVPLYGASVGSVYLDYEGPQAPDYPNPYVYTPTTLTATTYADMWQTNLIPTNNDVVWAYSLAYTTSGGITQDDLKAKSLGYTTTRRAADRHDFEFDPPASLSGSKLPFDNDAFEQAFNNDQLINQAQINVQYGSTTVATSTAANVTTYGARTVANTSTLPVDTAAAQTLADRLVNRYNTPRFTPVQLRTTAKMVRALAADAAHSKWRALLGIEHGIWQKAKITWTGSGAASQTAYSVIKGRKIDVTPSDTFVTLTLGNWTDNHSFILDTDVLDTDRLG